MSTDFSQYLIDAYISLLPKKILFISIFLLLFVAISRLPIVSRLKESVLRLGTARLLCGITLLALSIRIWWCLVSPTYFPRQFHEPAAAMDESSLISIASAQIAEQGIPLREDGKLSTRRPVGYSYLMGALYRIVGYHKDLFKIVQVLLECVVVILMFLLAKSLFHNEEVALVSAFLFAIYPHNWMTVNVFLDEFPFFVSWFLALYLICENLRKRKISHSITIGILLGVATAFRTIALYTPLLFFLAYLTFRMPFWKSLKQVFLAFALIHIVNSPWALITYKHYGIPCFFTTGRANLYATLNDLASWHNGYLPKLEEGGNPEFLNEENPVKKVPIGVRLAFEWVKRHPMKTIQWMIMRNFALFGFDLRHELMHRVATHAHDKPSFAISHQTLIQKLRAWSYAFVAIVGTLGCLTLILNKSHFFWEKYPGMLLFFLIFFYWWGVHGLFFGYRKYRWTIELILILPTAFFLRWITQLKPHQKNDSFNVASTK